MIDKMTIEQAIERLGLLYNNVYNYEPENVEEAMLRNQAIDMAIEALEKQVAKKPKFIDGNIKVFCPICAEPLNGDDYCGECGQAIDWSEEE